jgi:hypothetical protein
MTHIAKPSPQLLEADWVPFAGGELEAPRPKVLCQDCRARLQRRVNDAAAALPSAAATRLDPLCFACHRADLQRDRALKAAGELDTATDARFQFVLPLAPVDHSRLARLKVERREARVAQVKASPFVDRRRQAQITAQQVLQRLAQGLRARGVVPGKSVALSTRSGRVQLPDTWLPFAASR